MNVVQDINTEKRKEMLRAMAIDRVNGVFVGSAFHGHGVALEDSFEAGFGDAGRFKYLNCRRVISPT